MGTEPASLHIQQLVELLAVVSSFPDEASAVRSAVERSAQALEAEVAAVVVADRVAASIGFPAGQVPEADLVAVAQRRRGWLAVPGVGRCPAMAASWGGTHPGHLVLARWGEEGFSIEEQNLVRGMARLLELALTMLRTLQAEHEMRQHSERQATVNQRLVVELRERQRLLQHLFDIQRAISRRQPLQHILDTITSAAHNLFGDDIVGLWMVDEGDPERAWLRSVVGLDPEQARALPPVPLTDAGAAGAAMLVGGLVVYHGEADASPVIGQFAGGPVYASLAAPVHVSGTVSGALQIASRRPRRVFNDSDEQTLQAFAEHVSLALTDAYTVNRMNVALSDALTGLDSRGRFLERLAGQLERARRVGATVALLFLDLDRFKEINDSLGHSVGDQLLMVTADRVRSALRTDDVAARFGGDEFAVMLPGVSDPAGARAVAERIIALMAEPMLVARQRLRINASIGIALSIPGQTDPADLIRRADVAMYQAKRNGRGRAEVYRAAMDEAMGEPADTLAS
ncbi:MAG TPA: sensor domain-containing diguanylate cyclase [Rugosimonospora sp.]|nr:sensor domain-containing diguanylate cyclase [Rugosimonospora sp.]